MTSMTSIEKQEIYMKHERKPKKALHESRTTPNRILTATRRPGRDRGYRRKQHNKIGIEETEYFTGNEYRTLNDETDSKDSNQKHFSYFNTGTCFALQVLPLQLLFQILLTFRMQNGQW